MTSEATASRHPTVAIVTPYANHPGGVEQVNKMLLAMFGSAGYATRVVSGEELGNGLGTRVARRLLGLNRLLGRHFTRRHAATTDAVICNGEFSLGVEHPAAVASFHGCYYGYAQAMRPYLTARGYRALMRLAGQQAEGARGKYVVADSGKLATILEEQGIHVDAVIENAIDTERFRPPDGAVTREPKCIFVGSSDHYGKGFDILERLCDLGLKIDCVTTTRPRDPRLGWLGNVPNEELPAYYARYEAFLLPSRFEGCGLVALEAMACGTPIVMTAVGAGPDIAREIPEFIVDASWDAVASAMAARVRGFAGRRDELGARARDYVVRRHALSEWSQRWLKTLALLRERVGRA